MNKSNVTQIKQSPRCPVWDEAVTDMDLLARARGICNMAAVPSKVIERMQEGVHEKFHETELYKNLSFCQEICDLMMNGCDLDHDNANKHDRIAMVDQLIESLRTIKRRI